MSITPISDTEFAHFQRFIFDAAGISMADAKKTLVMGRLSKRLMQYDLDSFGQYFLLLASGRYPQEVQMAVDLLTTNETYFFRENKHFDFLRAKRRPLAHDRNPIGCGAPPVPAAKRPTAWRWCWPM